MHTLTFKRTLAFTLHAYAHTHAHVSRPRTRSHSRPRFHSRSRAPNPARAHAHSGAAVSFRARGCWRRSKPAQIYTLSVMEATARQPRHHALTLKRTLTKRRSSSRSCARSRASSKCLNALMLKRAHTKSLFNHHSDMFRAYKDRFGCCQNCQKTR